jgi:hypothetical protein
MNGQDLGKLGHADVTRDPAFWRIAQIREIDVVWWFLRVCFNGESKLSHGCLGLRPCCVRRRSLCLRLEDGQRVQKAAFLTLEVIDVLRLEHAVETRA